MKESALAAFVPRANERLSDPAINELDQVQANYIANISCLPLAQVIWAPGELNINLISETAPRAAVSSNF